MRQDKTLARILLIFSVANVALAAPAAVRQRYLDVAKAASEKRAPGSVNGETGGDLPPESSFAANHITTQASEATVSDNGATGDLPPESSPSAANRITTQALGASGPGNRATDDLPPKSPSAAENHITIQALGALGSSNGATDDLPPESSTSTANHITTQASGAPGSENGATGDLPPESPPSTSNRITTQALGAPGPGGGATDDLPSKSPSAAANHITTQALGSSGSGDGASQYSTPESSFRKPPHDSPPGDWAWFHRLSSEPEVPSSSSAAANRIAKQASGSLGSDDGALQYWTPESSLRMSPQDSPTHEGALGDGASSSHSSPTNKWAWLNDAASESSHTAAIRITTQALGTTRPSLSDPAHPGYLPSGATSPSLPDPAHPGYLPSPPHQASPGFSLSNSNHPWLIKDPRARKILVFTALTGFLGSLVAVGYENE
jgi:hypothetical protein